VLIICSIAFVQAYYFPWMIPSIAAATAAMSVNGLSVGEWSVVTASIIAIIVLVIFSHKQKMAR